MPLPHAHSGPDHPHPLLAWATPTPPPKIAARVRSSMPPLSLTADPYFLWGLGVLHRVLQKGVVIQFRGCFRGFVIQMWGYWGGFVLQVLVSGGFVIQEEWDAGFCSAEF